MSDFFNAPVDFQTAYFVVFGSILLYGVVLVLLDWLGQRQQRRAHKEHK